MDIETTPVQGALLIKPKIFGDSRGYFVETWHQVAYAEAGIDLPFVQDNHSSSTLGILRGLHFQKTRPQGKLVSVSLGAVFDVIVDNRPDSASYGKWYGAILSAENQHQLWVPPGCAHGFLVMTDKAHFHYKCTDIYCPWDEGAIFWDDPDLAIAWPLQALRDIDPAITAPIVSVKDAQAPSFKENSRHVKENRQV